jgi:hypothetical protein
MSPTSYQTAPPRGETIRLSPALTILSGHSAGFKGVQRVLSPSAIPLPADEVVEVVVEGFEEEFVAVGGDEVDAGCDDEEGAGEDAVDEDAGDEPDGDDATVDDAELDEELDGDEEEVEEDDDDEEGEELEADGVPAPEACCSCCNTVCSALMSLAYAERFSAFKSFWAFV